MTRICHSDWLVGLPVDGACNRFETAFLTPRTALLPFATALCITFVIIFSRREVIEKAVTWLQTGYRKVKPRPAASPNGKKTTSDLVKENHL